MKANRTVVYQPQHKGGLTMPQLNAIDLLASGKTDKETAELLSLSRTCITKWRLYSPAFQAALNRRRAEVWGAGIDRLRSLIPKALDALAEELEKVDSPNRLKAAVEVLKLAQLPDGWQQAGPIEAEAIVRQVVKARRAEAPGLLDELADQGKSLPPFEQHMEDTWQEMEERANVSVRQIASCAETVASVLPSPSRPPVPCLVLVHRSRWPSRSLIASSAA